MKRSTVCQFVYLTAKSAKSTFHGIYYYFVVSYYILHL